MSAQAGLSEKQQEITGKVGAVCMHACYLKLGGGAESLHSMLTSSQAVSPSRAPPASCCLQIRKREARRQHLQWLIDTSNLRPQNAPALCHPQIRKREARAQHLQREIDNIRLCAVLALQLPLQGTSSWLRRSASARRGRSTCSARLTRSKPRRRRWRN